MLLSVLVCVAEGVREFLNRLYPNTKFLITVKQSEGTRHSHRLVIITRSVTNM